MRRFSYERFSALTLAAALSVALAACGKEDQAAGGPGMVPQVSVVTVQPQRTPVVSELPGRVDAVRDAEIRARVTGIVEHIAFEPGIDVKKGQKLFKIDPAPYQATYDQAAAQVKQAQADLYSAKVLAERYAPLVKANAVSKQEYDNAVSSFRQAEAAVAAARANLTNARINLDYTDVTSPIDGRIGRPLVTEGALVESSTATQMALVQQLDPIYVDLTQSTGELAALRKAFDTGKMQRADDGARVTVLLEDGSTYDQPGKLLFTGITVDPSTSQVTLRAEVPNPSHQLLPGMYVRVRLEQGVDEQALRVPQQALQRTPDGRQSLMVVRDNKVDQIPVTTGNVVDNEWVITSGLKPGDTVVVEGFQKVRPGAPVQATPWNKGAGAKPGQGQQPGQPGQAGQAGQPPSAQGQSGQQPAAGQPAGQQQQGQKQ
ncbi:efflux RND transporter periplasmic adaptor subunit [Bordetella genomosp. 13]|uniref:Efflux transporter periplasmic adaptor subunit n=1 Tax=Bordetella genomosp. 13 TaxID=463040 RepID=A0A1W6ZBZ5_9BORD|nr:efflux RND transporter periplasmic adaptor subunit [Bordetella genomosp. 13]ARP94839.1 efflux transporter periplasmic adaptor subunit [Bordetella genomosp. 13]